MWFNFFFFLLAMSREQLLFILYEILLCICMKLIKTNVLIDHCTLVNSDCVVFSICLFYVYISLVSVCG